MVLRLIRALVISVVRCKLQPEFRIYVWCSPKSEVWKASNTSRKHGEEDESANVFVDHSKRRTTGRACFPNQGRVHILQCLFFFFYFLTNICAHNRGYCPESLPPDFFFAQKWWLEISKRCMMGNNFKRQKIVVLPSLWLKSLIKSLDVRRCQITVSVSEF